MVCRDLPRGEFLDKFFSEDRAELVKSLSSALSITPEAYRQLAGEVVAEWSAAQRLHTDWSDAASHLISQVRRKHNSPAGPRSDVTLTLGKKQFEQERERERRERQAMMSVRCPSPERIREIIAAHSLPPT